MVLTQKETAALKDLQTQEQSISQTLNGQIPSVDCNDSKGRNYQPKAYYTEKLVSCEYNNDVFIFGNSDIRKLLADIQIEEQNHAEMLWKYKTTNGMA